ncbi:hypothetical protein DL93DRAFT_1710694 [Clavulina sp. PMI_390]|nr:hypothetical protein DL93DRAFT_1710694 [Clavulina sp. PMI_390]
MQSLCVSSTREGPAAKYRAYLVSEQALTFTRYKSNKFPLSNQTGRNKKRTATLANLRRLFHFLPSSYLLIVSAAQKHMSSLNSANGWRQLEYSFPPDNQRQSSLTLESGNDGTTHHSVMKTSYPIVMYCIAIPYALIWLFFVFLFCPPLLVWFALRFPPVLLTPFSTFGGLVNRIRFCIIVLFIVFGLLFFNLYGLFWTMNILRLSPPRLQRQTEWSAVLYATGSLLFAAADVVKAIKESIGSLTGVGVNWWRPLLQAARASDRRIDSVLWHRLKPLATVAFFLFYFHTLLQCVLDETIVINALVDSTIEFPPQQPSSSPINNFSSYFDTCVNFYILFITAVMIFAFPISNYFLAFLSVPIAGRFGLLGEWAVKLGEVICPSL